MVERRRSIFDKFDRLSTREKVMVGGLLSAFIICIGAFLWVYIGQQITIQQAENASIRDGLHAVNLKKDEYL